MISSNEGDVVVKGPENEMLADLACLIKGIQNRNTKKGIHPIRSVLQILHYVFIGLTYKGDE